MTGTLMDTSASVFQLLLLQQFEGQGFGSKFSLE